jgi:hypothetical protein
MDNERSRVEPNQIWPPPPKQLPPEPKPTVFVKWRRHAPPPEVRALRWVGVGWILFVGMIASIFFEGPPTSPNPVWGSIRSACYIMSLVSVATGIGFGIAGFREFYGKIAIVLALILGYALLVIAAIALTM